MDNAGNIILDMAIVLIILLMISGIILNTTELLTDKAIKTNEIENIEVLINEVIDNLVNNPGTPENWQEYEKGTPGLAIINEEGEVIADSVSYEKFIVLKNNYKKLVDEKLFKSKIKTSLELIPLKSSVSSVKIGDGYESGDVYSVNKLVKCDFYKKYVIKDFQYPGKCNHNHPQNANSCNYFKIFKGNLRASNYYLLIDSNEKDLKYMLDTTRVVKEKYWENPGSDIIYLNDKINFYDDPSAVVFIHFNKANAKAVLVSVPKDFDIYELNYDYFNTNDCNLRIKAWF